MKVHPAVPEESPKAIQGTRAASATKRSIDEVEEPQEQRTPTPRYIPIVARAPQPSPMPSTPPIPLSPEGSPGYYPRGIRPENINRWDM
ncbi:hypothetical protein E4U48_006125 [Claviceps purpurea]|nr:hypothetical protein E4U48_006125 [Claviceps purpurea]